VLQPAELEEVRDDVRSWGLVGNLDLREDGPLVRVGVASQNMFMTSAPRVGVSRAQR
jgi:hypothetical protein